MPSLAARLDAAQLAVSPTTASCSGFAVAAVITATLSVACAPTAQIFTIGDRLNPQNLDEVEALYLRQFGTRAQATQAVTLLIILASLLAGATAVASIFTNR